MRSPGSTPDLSLDARVTRYGAVSGALALASDRALGRLVDDAPGLGHGAGGTTALLDVEGDQVFVKRITLTDREQQPEHVRSTANLFGLPPFFQYGVGSPGFGAWRELAANAMTTGWVLARRSEAFPLMYHWRILPGAAPLAAAFPDVDRSISYWGGSPAVRERFDALATASASIVLFLEYIPYGVSEWLDGQLALGPQAATAATAMVERRLRLDLRFLNTNRLVHFDAHFGNILTDGQRLYFADLGLATSPRFDLSPAESAFLPAHRSLDVCLALTMLVNRLVDRARGIDPVRSDPAERNELIRRCVAGRHVVDAPPGVTAVVQRYAPVAAVVNDFYSDLFGVSRTTPYPVGQIERAAAAIPDLAYLAGDITPAARGAS